MILEDQVSFLDDWRRYLEQRLRGRAVFVQRGSYREITALINNDELDFAWVCGYPYVANRASMRLLAMPLYHGKPLYQSYLIVPSSDRVTRSYADLEGKLFAYSDPNSNSGFLVPQYLMLRAGLDPQTLFKKTFFTYAHRKVVSAVATGVADGGAVDGYVWETLALLSPELTAKTRVAAEVARVRVPAAGCACLDRPARLCRHAGRAGGHECGSAGASAAEASESRRVRARRSEDLRWDRPGARLRVCAYEVAAMTPMHTSAAPAA